MWNQDPSQQSWPLQQGQSDNVDWGALAQAWIQNKTSEPTDQSQTTFQQFDGHRFTAFPWQSNTIQGNNAWRPPIPEQHANHHYWQQNQVNPPAFHSPSIGGNAVLPPLPPEEDSITDEHRNGHQSNNIQTSNPPEPISEEQDQTCIPNNHGWNNYYPPPTLPMSENNGNFPQNMGIFSNHWQHNETNFNQMPSAKPPDLRQRKLLPAWIREGLERMEQEKQKKSIASLENVKNNFDNSRMENLKEIKDEEESDAELPEENHIEDEDENENEEPEPTTQEENDEDKEHERVLKMRRMLTSILLEVTDQEISEICVDFYKKATKAPAKPLVQSTALASIGGIGLVPEYSSDEEEKSDSEDSLIEDEDLVKKMKNFSELQNRRLGDFETGGPNGTDEKEATRHGSKGQVSHKESLLQEGDISEMASKDEMSYEENASDESPMLANLPKPPAIITKSLATEEAVAESKKLRKSQSNKHKSAYISKKSPKREHGSKRQKRAKKSRSSDEETPRKKKSERYYSSDDKKHKKWKSEHKRRHYEKETRPRTSSRNDYSPERKSSKKKYHKSKHSHSRTRRRSDSDRSSS